MSYSRLFRRCFMMQVETFNEYKVANIAEIFAQIFLLWINVTFWYVIFSKAGNINGWTLGEMMVLQGFFWLFLGVFWLFFNGADDMDQSVLDGGFDKYLTRPVNPLILHLFSNMSMGGFTAFVNGSMYILTGIALGANVSIGGFLIGFLIMSLAAVILGIMMLIFAMSCFWIGKNSAFRTLWTNMWTLSDYPGTIFPFGAQMIFTIFLPIFFMQTFPALSAVNKLPFSSVAQIIIVELFLIGVWLLIITFVWQRALRRYEAYGG